MPNPYVGQMLHWWPGKDNYGVPQPGPLAAIVLRIDRVGDGRKILHLKVHHIDGHDSIAKCWDPLPPAERGDRVEVATFIEK